MSIANRTETVTLGLLLRSMLFAVAILLPSLVLYSKYGDYALNTLAFDEGVYLRLPYQAYGGMAPESIYREHAGPEKPSDYISRYPNAVLDVFAGALASLFHWQPVTLGIILDFVFGALSYVLLSLFFLRLFPHRLAAETAALLALAYPGSLIISQYFDFGIPGLGWLTQPKYVDYSLAIHRGIYTQVSYIPFLLSLLFLERAFLADAPRKRDWFVLGCISALTLYTYIFAWFAVVALVAQILCLDALRRYGISKALIVQTALRGFFCGLGHLLVALPAFCSLKHQSSFEIVVSPLIRQFWFCSPISLVVAGILLCCLWQFRARENIFFALAVVVCCIFAEVVLMNMQPLLQQSLTPYQIPNKYLHPLTTGMVALLFINWAWSNRSSRVIAPSACSLILVFFAWQEGTKARQKYLQHDILEEFQTLVRAISEQTAPDSVIAVMTMMEPFADYVTGSFSISPGPTLVSGVTGRPLLFQDWISWKRVSRAENLKREMALGWIFTGTPQLLWPCLEYVPGLPGDLFTSTWMGRMIRRVDDCKANAEMLRSYSACDILKDFRIDYILWPDYFDFHKPLWVERLAETVWTSKAKGYKLKRFKQADAIALYCPTAQHSEP